MKNKKTFSLQRLFRNNKFLLLFSFVLAIILWMIFSQNSQEDYTGTINDLPISIELSQEASADGLQIVSGGDVTASVRVTGNRLTVGTLTKDDIQVVAVDSISQITVPNTYKLNLSAKKNGVKSDYEVITVTPNSITVVADRVKEKEIAITDNVKYSYTVDQSLYAGKPVLSTDKIIIKGPQTEVNKVESAEITGEFSGSIKESTTKKFEVKLLNAKGKEVKSDLITTNIENNFINVTIPILSKKEVPIKVDFKNVPSGVDAQQLISISPTVVMLAGTKEDLSKIEKIELQAIDFSTITPLTTYVELPIEIPPSCMDISNTHLVKVDFNLNGYSSTRVQVKNFKVINVGSEFTAKVTSSALYVDIMGPASKVDKITSKDIKAIIDLKEQRALGTLEVPFTVEINGVSGCWSYNTQNNTVTISVVQKSNE